MNSTNNPHPPSLATTQTTWMAIVTAARHNLYDDAQTLVNKFRLGYGDILPLLICAASFSNSLLDTYAELIDEDPEDVLRSLALDTLIKGENPNV